MGPDFRKPVLEGWAQAHLQIGVGVVPWENEEEGLTGAEYVPEWKDPYSIKLSFPVPPKYLQSCVHASLVLCALPSSLPLGIPFILRALVWNKAS